MLIMCQETNVHILEMFQILEGLWALIFKQPTIFYDLVLTTVYKL